jgi:two-component system nitrogen regulation response regulator GlnG
MTGTILVADDEESIRWVLATALSQDGHVVEQAGSGDAALRRLLHDDVDVALVDISMAGLDGLELVSKLREVGSRTQVIVITGSNSMRNAVEAMKRGAYDYLTKPFDIEDVRRLIGRVLELRHEASKAPCVEECGQRRSELGAAIIGTTPAMQEIFKTVGRVAPTEATVLIQGESGTGKELIARAVHAYSLRSGGAFVALNCSAVPRDLLESELLIVKNIERPLIELVLERTHGNQLRAAAILGINRNTLHKKITQLNISPRCSAEDTG